MWRSGFSFDVGFEGFLFALLPVFEGGDDGGWAVGPGEAGDLEISEEQLRCSGDAPCVRIEKMGAQPGGSMITRKVTSAELKNSIIGRRRGR